jgi:hypothetical protein
VSDPQNGAIDVLSGLRAFSGMRVEPVDDYFGSYQITVCRRNVEKLSRDQIDQAVLDIREAWKREDLDVENLHKIVVLAHHYRADQDKCLSGPEMCVIRIPPPSRCSRG